MILIFFCLANTILISSDSAWIKVEQLKPYHAHKEEMIKINKGKRFQQAVDAVEEFLKKGKGKDQVSVTSLVFPVDFGGESRQLYFLLAKGRLYRILQDCRSLLHLESLPLHPTYLR